MESYEENEILETVPEEWSDIIIESQDSSISYGDGSSVIIQSPDTVQILYSNTDTEEEESSESEIYLEDIEASDKVVVQELLRADSSSVRAISRDNIKNLWKLEIGSTEYDILFPENASLSVIDGKLYNMGTSNITGVIIDSSLSDSTFFNYTFTVLPFTSSSTQTTVYRYGARSYLTYYRRSTSTSLETTVTYANADVIQRPIGWRLTPGNMVIAGLLLFSCLVSIVGGLIRR